MKFRDVSCTVFTSIVGSGGTEKRKSINRQSLQSMWCEGSERRGACVPVREKPRRKWRPTRRLDRRFRFLFSLSAISEFPCWNGLPLSLCSYLCVDRIIQNNFNPYPANVENMVSS